MFDDDDVDDDDDGHHSPDHGWGRPVKQPILRAPVLYQKMQPDYWWGTRGSKLSGAYVHYYPTVYTPTDTTQLGYYYQRAPFWRPDYRRLPPVPWPPHWHKRECIAHLPPARVSHPYAAVPVFPSYEPLPHGDSRPQLQPVPGSKQPQVPPAPPEDLNNSAGRSADGVR